MPTLAGRCTGPYTPYAYTGPYAYATSLTYLVHHTVRAYACACMHECIAESEHENEVHYDSKATSHLHSLVPYSGKRPVSTNEWPGLKEALVLVLFCCFCQSVVHA
jgi:hypothetical protein